MDIAVKINAADILAAIPRFRGLIQDWSPIWEDIAEDFRKMEAEIFSSGGMPQGWAPLSPSTLKRKQGSSILVETGELRSSLTSEGKGHIKRLTPKSLILGTSDKKAVFHQFGTVKMPARPVIQITPDARKRWLKLYQIHLMRTAKEAGLRSYRSGA